MDMQIRLDRFPGGRAKALTMSYDDGVRADVRLIEIFNKHGVKGTFHLNAGTFGRDGALNKEKKLPLDVIKSLYAGHEIAAHGYYHHLLTAVPDSGVVSEIMRDREALEEITGAPVRGMSYAYGAYNDRIIGILRTLGIEYCRTADSSGGFGLPEDLMRWTGTCHHKNDISTKADRFLAEKPRFTALLFYIWGHSYEFEDDGNWGLIEDFCDQISGRDDVWYVTNIEIVDYINAARGLRFTVKQDAVYNPSALDVWITADNENVVVKSGETILLL